MIHASLQIVEGISLWMNSPNVCKEKRQALTRIGAGASDKSLYRLHGSLMCVRMPEQSERQMRRSPQQNGVSA